MENIGLIETLQHMLALQQEMVAQLRILSANVNLSPSQLLGTDEKLMNRKQVQKYLGFGESTYKRKVKEGKLKPMNLTGEHKFRKSDLDSELEESKRRGRI